LGETVTDVRGATGPEKVAATLFVDFNVDTLHVACCFGNVDVMVILRVGDDGEDLGGELDGVTLCVVGLCSLPGSLLKRGAT
jgi:hypothetical protein